MNDLSPEELDEIRELIRQGKKLSAIKRYRECSDASLSKSKDAVEAMAVELNPASANPPVVQSKSGCAGLLVFFVGTLMAGTATWASLTSF
ncbi:hypothetical protein SAMN06265222_10689 [Neorhodopirellula lusitana]|uniref:Uncharacterized protein n=1 Tax=Neorhodopirellula lusitana TaxID=445327 RepID=A0ABY1Q830_9BACT|nr:hypothetical protein [Neorhodopirellula lusitana]SMP58653.1 hypothetical protein SAMN06265222_10689 [Neorhodopirellula lusitana]